MPLLGWVAVASLVIASAVSVWTFVRVVLGVLALVPDLGIVLQLESTWSIGGPMLVYGAVFALMAIGVALRWRIAHGITVLLLGLALIGGLATFVGGMIESGFSLESTILFGSIVVAWVCLILSWKAFWRRYET